MSQHVKLIDILLIEDNPGDVELIKIAFKKAKIRNNLRVIKNGEDALNYLFNNEKSDFGDYVLPDLILLDLNLPKVDGLEILKKIKHHDSLKVIPTVILTSSEEEEDIIRSYELHVNSYVKKPLGMKGFYEIVKNISDFWFGVVKLPSKRK